MEAPMNPPAFNPQSVAMPPPRMPAQQPDIDNSQIEELIEAVIDEKWKDIERNISRVIAWKDKTDARITGIETSMADLKEEFSNLQKAIVGKVGEYDHNILQVGSQLKAMEKAFAQVLPTFIENINELDRITQDMKR